MAWRRSCTVAVATLVACGPAVDDSGDGDSGGSSGTPDTVTDSAPATGPSPGTSTGTTTSGTTGATSATTSAGPTTVTTAGTTGTSSTSGVGSTGAFGCEDEADYRAVFIAGGLDRIRIFRADDVAGTCIWMTLVWPGGQSQYDVDVTGEWSVESVSRSDDLDSCDNDFPGSVSGEIPVPEAVGQATLSGMNDNGLPCEVGVDVMLQLIEDPDPPAYAVMCAPGLDLGTCP